MLNTKKIISAIKLDKELLSQEEQEEAAIILCHALRTYRYEIQRPNTPSQDPRLKYRGGQVEVGQCRRPLPDPPKE